MRRISVILGGSCSNYTTRIIGELEFETIVIGQGLVHDIFNCKIVFRLKSISICLTIYVGTSIIVLCQNEAQRWHLKRILYPKIMFELFDEEVLRYIVKSLGDIERRYDLSIWEKSLCDGLDLFRVFDIVEREIL